jgi:hypothetical protein
MQKEMRLEAERSKKLSRRSSDQSRLATIEEEETGSLIGGVETVVDDEVKSVDDEEQQDLGSRAMKGTRKEEVTNLRTWKISQTNSREMGTCGIRDHHMRKEHRTRMMAKIRLVCGCLEIYQRELLISMQNLPTG